MYEEFAEQFIQEKGDEDLDPAEAGDLDDEDEEEEEEKLAEEAEEL